MDPSEALTEIKDSLSWVLLVKRNKKNQYQFNQPANERRSCVPQIALLYLSFSVSRDQNPAKKKIDEPFTDSYKGLPWEYQYNFNPNWSVSKKLFEFF